MGKSKILIVEDEPGIAESLENSIEGLGYETASIVATGEDAINAVKSGNVDLVLMDIILSSEMMGTEAANYIWSKFQIPIIFLTGFVNSSFIDSAKLSQPFGYILKPYEEKELFALIEIALNKSQMERRNFRINSLLKIARKINQIINRENDLNKFIRAICKSFTVTTEFNGAWVILFDELNNITTTIEEGIGDKFNAIIGTLQKVELPAWLRKTVLQNGIIESFSQPALPFLGKDEKVLSVRLESEGRVYGAIALILKQRNLVEEESLLIKSIAFDIALAIKNMDMTRKAKIIEESLFESEKRLRQFMELSPDAVIIHSDGKITFANEACVNLCKASNIFDLINKDISDLMLPKSLNILNQNSDSNSSKFLFHELKLKRLDGVIIDVTVLPNPIVFQNDNAVQLVIKDITERKEAEEVIKKYSKELEESNASKDRFFSIISHDLRSPFQGLLGLTTIATEEFDELTVDELKEFLSNINHSAKSLFNLIENLLQWSRIQRGKIEVKLAQIDLYYDVQYNINLLQPNANTKGLRIVNEVDKTIEVLADTTAFNSVLQNLISNAIKFTKSGGEIKITSEVNNGFAELTVTDNGIGIPEDILPDLFRIDSQHSTLGTEKESGTGLGLIICKELVEMQGGKIWVKSKVDEGTSFTFTLQIP
ncbi:MAG: ATP-binding protein [Ignavibacteriaceae bacterium]